VQKERFDKWITLACAHQRMDDGHLSQKKLVAKKERNMLCIKGLNKRENLRHLASYHMKLLVENMKKKTSYAKVKVLSKGCIFHVAIFYWFILHFSHSFSN
jgi:hypothetical protein